MLSYIEDRRFIVSSCFGRDNYYLILIRFEFDSTDDIWGDE